MPWQNPTDLIISKSKRSALMNTLGFNKPALFFELASQSVNSARMP